MTFFSTGLFRGLFAQVIGTLFGNRSKVRDRKILLILVKPTIMLKDERDQEAYGAMEAANIRVY